tara:strand:+ start:1481 stop:2191 length:711 start_codon:yes stop_codon:yes gene_type:complete
MTTLIGLKAEKGKKGVILASDLSRTRISWKPQGDIIYKEQTKSEGEKIYTSDNEDFALCMTGVYDQLYIDFLHQVIGGNGKLKEAVDKGFFPEFRDLNLQRWEGKIPNTEKMSGLLIATRYDEPTLYTCWPLGRIEQRNWTSVGSGSEYALNSINEQSEKLNKRFQLEEGIPKYLTIKKGIDIAVGALDEASQDLYTGGLDLVVVTEDGIQNFGKGIKDAINNARRDVIKGIKKRL